MAKTLGQFVTDIRGYLAKGKVKAARKSYEKCVKAGLKGPQLLEAQLELLLAEGGEALLRGVHALADLAERRGRHPQPLGRGVQGLGPKLTGLAVPAVADRQTAGHFRRVDDERAAAHSQRDGHIQRSGGRRRERRGAHTAGWHGQRAAVAKRGQDVYA